VFELDPFATETECESCGHVLDPRPSGKIDLKRDIGEFIR
jgi:ribosomal protein S27E